ncbi:MAG: CBS domain-containing protein [Rhizobiaceae bacterium]|nr:CBS domain-containing protein [Rhizobiaceae bacterium]
MSVKDILAEKGTTVFTVQPEQSLTDAVRVLGENRIGALVVTDAKGAIIGILSERDIVRHLAKDGPQVLLRSVSTAMTAAVQTCKPQESIEQVMARMTRGRFRHLPVEDAQGRLGGIISIGDVVKKRIEDIQREADEIRNYIAMA